ncbi:DUF1697 domain-containing protein [Sphingobacterium sp. CZ-2]|uniref:DUF1697 domain-containing protein n=1 Tax=Sphingobacterium sp. CZ-2 TaxID=2557994 RepID=UPI0010701B0C|nr:DUF1697 domain-containing protein [Sphingobacterium sp. CZ-2]QBR13127.1 DUF1697 domain-containing protein [Sphingobacterium sp. CZ-2]
MNSFIIFLRAVNVSGKNLIKMADLKALLVKEGYQDVKTYIQSGNVFLKSNLSAKELKTNFNQLLKKHFQLEISCFVLTIDQVKKALANNPIKREMEGNKLFFTFLDDTPKKENIDALEALDISPEEYHLNEDLLYFYLPNGMSNSKLNNNFFEKKLKVNATGRNLNTINKMLQLANE